MAELRLFSTREAAHRHCGPGEQVIATGQKVGRQLKAESFFLAPAEATDNDIQELAFQAKYGRPLGEAERILISEAQRMGKL